MSALSLPSATKLRRLCFHRRVSVHGGGGGVPGPGKVCSQEGAWSRGVPGPGRGVCSGGCMVPGGTWSGGGLVPGGAWSRGGAWSGGWVVAWSQGGAPGRGGAIPASTEADPLPGRDGYCCRRYASYWNAFFFHINFKFLVAYKKTRLLIRAFCA